MRVQILMGCALLICLPCLGQSSQDDSETPPESPLTQVRMMVPPPVSGIPYATNVGAEERSNFLRAGITVSGGYIWNLDPSMGLANVNEGTYLVQPTFAYDRTTSRFHSTLTYNPTFNWFWVPETIRTTDQSLSADLEWRVAPYVNFRVGENFLDTSTAFGQILPSFQPSVGSSTQLLTPGIVGLYEPQMWTQTSGGLTWQYARNDMVAGNGWLNTVDFTDPTKSGGFNNTDTVGGSGSWMHRLRTKQYIGGLYQYATTQANPVVSTEISTSQTQLTNLFGFYTVYLTARLSLSVQGGGEYVSVIERLPYPEYHAWKPAGTASLGWQGDHTSFAASFGRVITAGGGLLDAYSTNMVDASGRWQMTPKWAVGLNGHYSNIGNLTPDTWSNAIQSGHTSSGTADLEHRLSTRLTLSGSYSHVNQTWGDVGVVPSGDNNPNSDRILFSLSFMFSRPIGR